jgi:hypothetical protein
VKVTAEARSAPTERTVGFIVVFAAPRRNGQHLRWVSEDGAPVATRCHGHGLTNSRAASVAIPPFAAATGKQMANSLLVVEAAG